MHRTTTLRPIAQLRRRLERAELDLLRQVCAEQAARIEALEAELAESDRYAAWADQRADLYHHLANELAEQTDAQIGITRSGEAGVIRETVAH